MSIEKKKSGKTPKMKDLRGRTLGTNEAKQVKGGGLLLPDSKEVYTPPPPPPTGDTSRQTWDQSTNKKV